MTARRHAQHPDGESVNAGKSRPVAEKAAAIDAAQARPLTLETVVKRALAVAVVGAGIYLVLPKLMAVLGAWPRLATLNPAWFTVCLAAELVSFTCNFGLQRLALRTKGWFPVVTAGLAGNAVTNSLPGGDAAGAAVQFHMLTTAGFDTDTAVGGLVLAAGGRRPAGAAHLCTARHPGRGAGQPGAGAYRPARDRRVRPVRGLRRDRVALGLAAGDSRACRAERVEPGHPRAPAAGGRPGPAAAGRLGFDYGCLLAALRATGTGPQPSVVLLAYAGAGIVALFAVTPGGLGIVEASLSGLLILAGVRGGYAVLATLAYRIASYWLPLLAGPPAYLLFRRRYGRPVPRRAT